ncbi:hypothetical protein P280DRAFT_549930 [Massarina eburnea CBS 473.64]|uniref:Peptidase C14 caspase domain-containing protein n=1 Tax=Massarina eburnea CBS 473.64 TaxID=1395130 RepID=A0A6A6RXP3_9PLEO|nr:hypothetical protein P280DRAFT_549930 [Massarina eburnea CBS 473.64]
MMLHLRASERPFAALKMDQLRLDSSDQGVVVVEQPLKTVDLAVEEFRKIFDEKKPTAQTPIRHDSTAVLLLSFDSEAEGSGNLNVAEEVERLKKVFVDDYSFEVENKVMSKSLPAQLQAYSILSTFAMKHDREHALLIIYYAGHGWRSRAERKTGFHLLSVPPDRHEGKEPMHGSYVEWEMTEHILSDLKSDVLVIFDCCDAGYLQKLRSPGRAFEYLLACEQGKYTHGPSETSFTEALIWALKGLKGPPFTTRLLRERIAKYSHLPNNQKPVWFARLDVPESIWISKIHNRKGGKGSSRSSRSTAEFRDPNYDFVDIRLFFNQRLSANDAEHVANMLKPLFKPQKPILTARHVSFLDKGSCESPSLTSPAHSWRKAKIVLHLQRFMKRRQGEEVELEDLHTRKRQRLLPPTAATRFKDGARDSSVDLRPMTPASEGDGSDLDVSFRTDVEPDLTRVSRTMIPLGTTEVRYVRSTSAEHSEGDEE